jgi:hypothetical protein
VDPEEFLSALAASTAVCILFDHIVHAIQEWQRSRFGMTGKQGFGWLGRTIVSLVINAVTGAVVLGSYYVVGKEPRDAYLIGACLWLMVTVPVLVTSRFIDDQQKRILSVRILGWLVKTSVSSVAAALFISTHGG